MTGRFGKLELGALEERDVLAQHGGPRADGPAQMLLARAAFRGGRFEEALRLYTRALSDDRALIEAWVGQVRMLVELDECHEARVWARKAQELFRGQGDLLAAEAQAAARLGDRSALALSDAALQAGGDTPLRWQVRGEIMLTRRDPLAGECFERALRHPAGDWFEAVVAARIYAYYGRLANALHLLRRALESEPGQAYVWLLAGQTERELGLVGPARQSLGRALELQPGWPEALQALSAVSGGRSLLTRLARLVGWRGGRRR